MREAAKSPGGAGSREIRVPQQARSRLTRERVLEAATDCFESRGYDETTTAMIAAEAGIAVGTLYGYFNNKREILLELIDGHVHGMAEYVIAQLDPERWKGADPREKTRSLIDAIFHTQRLQPGMQRIMWERYFKDEDFRRPVESIRRRVRAALDALLEAERQEGVMREVDLEMASYVVFNSVQWNATQIFIEGDAKQIAAAAEATADMIASYLLLDCGDDA
ncbi:MAG: TetR/AcrR family transcriptional regulator [Deltaproteobacteria bacterium]|nr:TetR/AcrR family transcriptional regulator [Deltaproteobacteria bacterium]MBW2417200.1 TetR/AcrR family transcriptional regulator [Deltaproteobacteria bacterium]